MYILRFKIFVSLRTNYHQKHKWYHEIYLFYLNLVFFPRFIAENIAGFRIILLFARRGFFWHVEQCLKNLPCINYMNAELTFKEGKRRKMTDTGQKKCKWTNNNICQMWSIVCSIVTPLCYELRRRALSTIQQSPNAHKPARFCPEHTNHNLFFPELKSNVITGATKYHKLYHTEQMAY